MRKYPQAKVLFSRSSLVGRIDVVRRKPHYRTLKIYENGNTIDTVRSNPPEDYQIDPRVPHTLMQDPVMLILGLSGDGITKTAKALSTEVYGVEINPAMVRLQTRELAAFNAKSYEDIDVTVMDGRSFLAQNDRKYDIITLMNAHFARGRTVGRAPNPEYLHTREALAVLLGCLDLPILLDPDILAPTAQPDRLRERGGSHQHEHEQDPRGVPAHSTILSARRRVGQSVF